MSQNCHILSTEMAPQGFYRNQELECVVVLVVAVCHISCKQICWPSNKNFKTVDCHPCFLIREGTFILEGECCDLRGEGHE